MDDDAHFLRSDVAEISMRDGGGDDLKGEVLPRTHAHTHTLFRRSLGSAHEEKQERGKLERIM